MKSNFIQAWNRKHFREIYSLAITILFWIDLILFNTLWSVYELALHLQNNK